MRKEITRIIEFFEKREEVSALFLFGSFDTGRERPDSDIEAQSGKFGKETMQCPGN